MDDGEKNMMAAAHPEIKIIISTPTPIRFSFALKELSYSYSSSISNPLKKEMAKNTNGNHGTY